jgi:hypothetical protein
MGAPEKRSLERAQRAENRRPLSLSIFCPASFASFDDRLTRSPDHYDPAFVRIAAGRRLRKETRGSRPVVSKS